MIRLSRSPPCGSPSSVDKIVMYYINACYCGNDVLKNLLDFCISITCFCENSRMGCKMINSIFTLCLLYIYIMCIVWRKMRYHKEHEISINVDFSLPLIVLSGSGGQCPLHVGSDSNLCSICPYLYCQYLEVSFRKSSLPRNAKYTCGMYYRTSCNIIAFQLFVPLL